MLNKIVIIGRLGRDPQLRITKAGKSVCIFSAAVDSGYGERKVTDWFRVIVFGKQADICCKHLKKGALVSITGSLHLSVSSDEKYKASLEIIADDVIFLPTRSDTAETQHIESGYQSQTEDTGVIDIPF